MNAPLKKVFHILCVCGMIGDVGHIYTVPDPKGTQVSMMSFHSHLNFGVTNTGFFKANIDVNIYFVYINIFKTIP